MADTQDNATPTRSERRAQEDLAALSEILAGKYDLSISADGGTAAAGRGGMATVYLAEDMRHERWVAIKVLKRELAANLGAERFLREIRIAAQLHHPHILGLLDSGGANGLLYYVMPFVGGETLRERVERVGPLPIPEAIRTMSQVADALSRAHQAGVVHRDIKPENILIEGRNALVTDFGVAKAVTDAQAASDTAPGFVIGTPAYMAPEQAAGDEVDHRADLYALGIVSYEMLTGRIPFSATTPQQMIAAHQVETPAPVESRRPEVPAALAAILARCLEKDPADRWQTADELIDALEALPLRGGTPSTAMPALESETSSPALAWARRIGLMLLGALVLLALLGLPG